MINTPSHIHLKRICALVNLFSKMSNQTIESLAEAQIRQQNTENLCTLHTVHNKAIKKHCKAY